MTKAIGIVRESFTPSAGVNDSRTDPSCSRGNPIRYWDLAMSGADSIRIGENVGPISLARFVWNMAHVTSGDGLSCTVPIADLAVNWDEDRSEELFQLIIEDRTDDVPKSLCTKDGMER